MLFGGEITKNIQNKKKYGHLFFVVAYTDVVARVAEGVPGDVQPTVAGEQLVGIGMGAQEVHKALELLRILRSDIRSLSYEVL